MNNIAYTISVELPGQGTLGDQNTSTAKSPLDTTFSIGPQVLGNSVHVVVASTTAVGVGSTVLTVTSTVMAPSL